MAVRITFKRSSIPNKRPTAQLLEPGELALNTNALTPGLFFEADNDTVVKVGPTAVGTEAPALIPSLGESWYNEITGELNIGTLAKLSSEEVLNIWQRVSSPYLGGTNGYVVFVAPEFPNATDNLNNNGQANPFQTLNRACIEVAKLSITKQNEIDDVNNNRFTIVVAPGRLPVYNDPGVPLPNSSSTDNFDYFSVNFDQDLTEGGQVTLKDLIEFNPETGGLLVPRGTSIVGMDLRKTNIVPSYVPAYVNPVNGAGIAQPITGILKWTGNSLVRDLTFRDKNPEAFVNDFKVAEDGTGILISTRPHGFAYNDAVFITFSPGADRSPLNPAVSGISTGIYYVNPVDLYSFRISITSLIGQSPNYVERGQLPDNDQGIGYIISATCQLYSHHRLRCLYNATTAELAEFYQKVQAAYPVYFNGRIDQANVSNPGETEIVAPVFTAPVGNKNLESNLNSFASPYWQNSSVKSMYGLCGVEQNGDLVSGFRSAIVSNVTVASLQTDAFAYEVYATLRDPATGNSLTKWYSLAEVAWNSIAPTDRPQFFVQVPNAFQLEVLNNTALTDIRYYYRTQVSEQGFSYGIVDTDVDFRHFGFRTTSTGFSQIDSSWCLCTAVGFWALNGGEMTVTNSANNFGSVAVRSEGFVGIGTIGGALPENQGFAFAGVRMPLELQPTETANDQIFSLNSNVISVTPSPGDEDVDNIEADPNAIQLLNLGAGFEPISLLPFSLAPGSAVWITTPTQTVRGFLADDGLTTAILNDDGTTTLRIRRIDSSIPMTTTPVGWNAPYIRRFNDPRSINEQSYALILSNTTTGHKPPQQSSVLRLAQTTPSNNAKLVRPLVQFDPGPNGGWGRVFQVMFSEGSFVGDSGQINEVMINRFSDQNYYVGLSLADGSRPWLTDSNYAHGQYVTYESRNWYAAANDLWTRMYYSDKIEPISNVEVIPPDFLSVFATTASTELQIKVDQTYQGQYANDPYIVEYPERYYYRGSQTAPANYNFDFYYDADNGSSNFGLMRNTTSTSVVTTTNADLDVNARVISVASTENFPNPKFNFVVAKIRNSTNTRIEYVQVVGVDNTANTLTVIRGIYETPQTDKWPSGSGVVLQAVTPKVEAKDYDYDWMPSKLAMIRFFEVMGFKLEDILAFLRPRPSSTRNISASEFNLPINKGYAIANGPWAFEFNRPSLLTASYHAYHSVGYYDYSRGLPQYQNFTIPTKQYYDFLSTSVWGSKLLLFATNEKGDVIVDGEFKEGSTGRPYGSYSSNIQTFTRQEAGGGSEDQGGVKEVDTGIGLIGGPITSVGTITLAPANDETIGGVKPGQGLTVEADGTLNISGGIGTVTSITAGIGLEGGTITTEGTIDLKPPTPPTSGVGIGEIGGIYPFFGMNFDPDTGETNVNITDNLDGESKNYAISQYAANILQNQIQALVGVNVLAGTFDASTGRLVTVSPAGAAKGFVVGQNVPPASTSIDNYFVIVVKGGSGAAPPLPPGPSQPGDWYICQSDAGTSPAWLLIDFDNAEIVASQVTVTPPIPGIDTAGNVQSALQAIELQAQDRVEFVQVQDEDNTNALFADVTAPVPTANDGTTLKIGVKTASLTAYGVTKLTDDFSGTSKSLALTQFGASQLNAKVDALAGADVLAGTYDSKNGVVLTTTPAGSAYLKPGLNCPPANQVPDNFYVLVTVSGAKGPPGAAIPPNGVQSGDWFIVQREVGVEPAWVTIDFENSVVTASQVKLQPSIDGISSGNVQGALEEIVVKTSSAFTDIKSSTGGTSGIRVTNTAASLNGRESTIQLLPATASDIGGVFVGPGSGIQVTPSGSIGLTPATRSVIGGVIVGEGLNITPTGVLSLTAPPSLNIFLIDSLTPQFNGATKTFELNSGGRSVTPTNNASLLVSLGGVVQIAGDAYNIVGNQITFTEAPPANTNFYAVCFSGSVAFTRVTGSSATVQQVDNIAGGFNGTRTLFSLTSGGIPILPTVDFSVIIVIGGIWQSAGSAYTIQGSSITFTEAPPAGATFYGIALG